MGMLVDGVWQNVGYDTKETKGHFKRAASQFRNWITATGEAGPTGSGGFKAEAGPLSSLCLARLPLGTPHADLPQAEEAR